jgi:hypothetical protein
LLSILRSAFSLVYITLTINFHYITHTHNHTHTIYQSPNLRTVGLERVSPAGLEFVLKDGPVAYSVAQGRPISILWTFGQMRSGEEAAQWRAEGHCSRIRAREILDCIPPYTLTSIISSRRFLHESSENEPVPSAETSSVSEFRKAMEKKSHFVEVVQKTRLEVEAGQISEEELEASLRAFRFYPDRIECMHGSPDTLLWDRWEWQRDNEGDCPEGSLAWRAAQQLIPH